MKYRHLGRAGIQVSELSFGSWVTFGTQVDVKAAATMMASVTNTSHIRTSEFIGIQNGND